MVMKFSGTLTDLRNLLRRHDIVGSWEQKPNGVHMLRCPDGANLHWASGSKSLWFIGQPGCKRKLESYVVRVLNERLSERGPSVPRGALRGYN